MSTKQTSYSLKSYYKHKEKNLLHMADFKNQRLYGGLRILVLERDGHKCVECGMCDKEHRETWKRSISIHHIDGNGSTVPFEKRNNTMENLQTLCFSCHAKKDGNLQQTRVNGKCKSGKHDFNKSKTQIYKQGKQYYRCGLCYSEYQKEYGRERRAKLKLQEIQR